MQFEILIEETISDIFYINAHTREEAVLLARQKYRPGEFVLEPGHLLDVKFIPSSDDEAE